MKPKRLEKESTKQEQEVDDSHDHQMKEILEDILQNGEFDFEVNSNLFKQIFRLKDYAGKTKRRKRP